MTQDKPEPGSNTGPNGECLTCNGFGTTIDIAVSGRTRTESCDDCEGSGMGQ